MMKSIPFKAHWFSLAIISLALSWMAYAVFYHTDEHKEQDRFQSEFNQLENKQIDYAQSLLESINTHSIVDLWDIKALQNSPYIVHLYKDNKLAYWNNNNIDFSDFKETKDAHFVGQTNNGFYLIDQYSVHDIHVFVATKIKNEYYYQNTTLQNNLSSNFTSKNQLSISFEEEAGSFPIISTNGNALLHIQVLEEKTIGQFKELIILSLYLFGIVAILITLHKLLHPLAERYKIIVLLYPTTLLVIRFLIVQNNWGNWFNNFQIYDPNLYAHSYLIPNLGSLIISLFIVLMIVWWLASFLVKIDEKRKFNTPVLIAIYLVLLLYSVLISVLFESLVINSSINLVIDEVFSLDIYSIIALVIIAFLFFSYYILIRQLSIKIINSTLKLTTLALIWFISGAAFYLIEIFFFEHHSLHATWPVLINALMFYLATKSSLLNSTKYHILIVIVIGFYAAIFLLNNNEANEYQKRELYANQLITDQDPTMELEYEQTIHDLLENPEFYRTLEEADFFSAPNFSLQLENCCFDSYWEQYELSFFLFNKDGTPMFEYISDKARTKESLIHIIEHHSTPSTLANQLYFVLDYFDQLSYVGHQTISISNEEEIDFFVLFKSKKIPEKIGFPRLLMNEKSYALQNLEDYSVARYSDNQLVMRYGTFDYPLNMNSFHDKIDSKPTFHTIDGISHLVYKLDEGVGVIISKPTKSIITQMSTFSYLVLFFGVFTLLILLIYNIRRIFPLKTLQISVKVQTVLISMVVGAFLIFVVLATQNVTRQYNANTLETMREKTNSVEAIIDQRFGINEELSMETNGDYFNFLLKRLSYVFVADINFYTTTGELFASSQTKLFEKGITSKQINSRAFYALNQQEKSEYFHHENIGNLTFFSGYLPFINHDGKLLGYVNLQHFSKQNSFEKQMNDFIVSVINITVLLLVVSVLLAIIISGWITAPLRLIQQSFSTMEFGKKNQPIRYTADDEIGALVKEYNHKLEELELKAMELARSERESAWREMAKQVAHEIKNPLTPMKLSVQHFQRSFDPSDPRSKEKMQRLFSSLIEQIDALTNIANEFSNFAKMPKANEESLDFKSVLESLIELYQNEQVQLTLSLENCHQIQLYADKDLLLRVFNNLIKNAIQATPEDTITNIAMKVIDEGKNYLISVQDNGTGIPNELKDKMFVPNFTTKSTGSGLGLAMSKQIIQTHNGSIWFDSVLGEGTIFYVALPKHQV